MVAGFLIALLAGELPAPADAPPLVVNSETRIDASPDRLEWEELPAPIRARLETGGLQKPQAVALVSEAPAPDSTERRVDHGTVLFTQSIAPQGGLQLNGIPNGKTKYGAAGRGLWLAKVEAVNWWCGRDLARFKPNNAAQPNVYCLRDTDEDGRFDVMYENDQAQAGYPSSAFLIDQLGHDEKLKTPVPYAPDDRPLGIREAAGVRYFGPLSGEIDAQGRLVNGVVRFDVMVGPDPSAWARVRSLLIRLDGQGHGDIDDVSGVRLEVESVDVDGTARVKLLAGFKPGPTQITGLDRDALLKQLGDVFNPDGTWKAGQGEAAQPGVQAAPPAS